MVGEQKLKPVITLICERAVEQFGRDAHRVELRLAFYVVGRFGFVAVGNGRLDPLGHVAVNHCRQRFDQQLGHVESRQPDGQQRNGVRVRHGRLYGKRQLRAVVYRLLALELVQRQFVPGDHGAVESERQVVIVADLGLLEAALGLLRRFQHEVADRFQFDQLLLG